MYMYCVLVNCVCDIHNVKDYNETRELERSIYLFIVWSLSMY